MIYLRSIKFPKDKTRPYPYVIPSIKDLKNVEFSSITIFAGSNGSGKSTILNVIAEKMNTYVPGEKTIGNISGYFNWFVSKCRCEFAKLGNKDALPASCKLIKSEDIMDIINVRRKVNEKTEKQFDYGKNKTLNGLDEEMFGVGIQEQELTNSQRFHRSLLKGYNCNLHDHAKDIRDELSNGETSINRFEELMIDDDSLYLLDEPENSLSPKMQLKLIEMIQECAKYFNCQFIIATHSPFMLSLGASKSAKLEARIYDLDNIPVQTKHWHQLENIKEYAELFFANKLCFETQNNHSES